MAVCSAIRFGLIRSRSTVRFQNKTVRSSHTCLSAGDIREKLRACAGGSIDLEKRESGIAVITINNPARMNALSGSMMLELEERVHDLETWSEGKAVIVQGAAGTFCSGSDII